MIVERFIIFTLHIHDINSNKHVFVFVLFYKSPCHILLLCFVNGEIVFLFIFDGNILKILKQQR